MARLLARSLALSAGFALLAGAALAQSPESYARVQVAAPPAVAPTTGAVVVPPAPESPVFAPPAVAEPLPAASRVLAGVREYPTEILEALVTLSADPALLTRLAAELRESQQPPQAPAGAAPEIARAVQTLSNMPEAILIGAGYPEELAELRRTHSQSPRALAARLAQLRERYALAEAEAARAWQRLLERDPLALGDYRDFLTQFCRDREQEYGGFASVEALDRRYYYACPPSDEVVLGMIAESGSDALKQIVEQWAAHSPQAIDDHVLSGAAPAPTPTGQTYVTHQPESMRQELWRAQPASDGQGIGLVPVILQPAADQPPGARLAYAVAEHDRLWALEGTPDVAPADSYSVAQAPGRRDYGDDAQDAVLVREEDGGYAPAPVAQEVYAPTYVYTDDDDDYTRYTIVDDYPAQSFYFGYSVIAPYACHLYSYPRYSCYRDRGYYRGALYCGPRYPSYYSRPYYGTRYTSVQRGFSHGRSRTPFVAGPYGTRSSSVSRSYGTRSNVVSRSYGSRSSTVVKPYGTRSNGAAAPYGGRYRSDVSTSTNRPTFGGAISGAQRHSVNTARYNPRVVGREPGGVGLRSRSDATPRIVERKSAAPSASRPPSAVRSRSSLGSSRAAIGASRSAPVRSNSAGVRSRGAIRSSSANVRSRSANVRSSGSNVRSSSRSSGIIRSSARPSGRASFSRSSISSSRSRSVQKAPARSSASRGSSASSRSTRSRRP